MTTLNRALGVVFSCTSEQLTQVFDLVQDNNLASEICAKYDCSFTASSCVLQYLAKQQKGLRDDVDAAASKEVSLGLDIAFILFSGYLVFGPMQLGFALLCAGAIRSKNSTNVLLKNILDACTGALGFYILGYGFAYGHKFGKASNGFIGNWNLALSYTTEVSAVDFGTHLTSSTNDFSDQGWHMWFFQWSFCATATTIVSGAVAERCTFVAYLAYAFFISAFVYPVVVHWVWSPDGWLSAYNTSRDGYALILRTGALDFAGSGVVHMTGGMAALIGAWIIGPRIGRYDASGKVNEMKGHSATLVVMGTFLFWFGYYGFAPGANMSIATETAAVIVARTAVTTTLASASAGLTTLFWRYLVASVWDAPAVCNGCLGGLVAISAACALVEPWAALICGAGAALVYLGAAHVVLHKMKVDDPVNAVALHLACGLWGLIFPGLLAKPGYVLQVYGEGGLGPNLKEAGKYGILYGGHGQVLLCQFIEALVICVWVGAMMGAFFQVFKMVRWLRVPVDQELAGLDVAKQAEIYDGSGGVPTGGAPRTAYGPNATTAATGPAAYSNGGGNDSGAYAAD